MSNALGMIETISIPVGIEAGDAMMKASSVELSAAQTVCAGKFIVIVTGDVSAVSASLKAGAEVAGQMLVDSIMIPNIDKQVPLAINACSEVVRADAVGIMETFSLCAAVIAADQAVKAADVHLIEVRLGRGLGGKSFVIMTGDVAAVTAAVQAAGEMKEVQGLMSQSVVIPSAHPDILKAIL
ncbi:MAG: BMC domain-containing protein [Eubacteriales bacterium]